MSGVGAMFAILSVGTKCWGPNDSRHEKVKRETDCAVMDERRR